MNSLTATARCATTAICAALLLATPAIFAEEKKPRAPTAAVRNPIDVDPAEYLDRISLPPGFSISLWADNVPGARSMARGSSGTIFVGTRVDNSYQTIGKVYAVTDGDGDGKAERVVTVGQDLNMPNGVALLDGHLYVAEIDKVIRYRDIENNLDNVPEPGGYWRDLPQRTDTTAGSTSTSARTVASTSRWARPATSVRRSLSRGLSFPCCPMAPTCAPRREVCANSVGFDWHPTTGELWFTDNGRDLWGDDQPPEELNRVTTRNQHFGFPYRYGKSLVDEEFPTTQPASAFAPAAVEFPAHNALLAVRFYEGEGFPAGYSDDVFIAAHGSWNRSVPDGYKIFRLKMEDGEPQGYEDFAAGWLTENLE